uniref:39S ribosomal protein L13, mitochondrial n=1 Tax=Clastoptera arizonana TaxID=38151 RepID=A0A1B6DE18_9HEMI
MSAFKRVQQWNTMTRIWHLFDAEWQNPFHSAEVIKKYLQGLTKPIYAPTVDVGDHVVVINTRHVALPGDEWRRRTYFHHTGYPGGASWTWAWELHEKDPTMIMKKAVYHSMKGNLQRRYTMQRLHLFPDKEIPQEILENIGNQIPILRQVPRRLQTYSETEIKEFPKIMDYPKDYVLR